MTEHQIKAFAMIFLAAFLALELAGCSGVEKAKPTPKSAHADNTLTIDTPEIMRGTVASETIVLGYEQASSPGYRPVIATGYGLVVGLNGTGSRDIPPQLRAFMLAEAAKSGIGNPKYGEQIAELSPERLLDSPDTAVVIVEAVVPQGAVKGTKFDVRVYADPSTGTTSIEGGRLWTTQLRPGMPKTGGAQAAELAIARGPVFVNPFAEPGAIGRDNVNRVSGRILNGGEITKDMPLKLRMANPSHARVATLQTAINTRFPQEPGQRDPTARGESDELIELHVPPSFRGETDQFIELLRHTTISQSNPESVAMSVRRTVLASPIVANAASLRWQALGTRVLPLIKDLYDYPEEAPRLAALRAGAKLNDSLAVPQLLNMAASGSPDARVEAIELLADMRTNPQIDTALRKLLNDNDTEIRLQAYEALVKRGDPYLQRYVVDSDKFVIDVVESDMPLIYITQAGQPRIAIFGIDLAIERPATVSTWSNRFMIKSDPDDKLLEVYYRAPESERGLILRTEPDLAHFAQFLGHKTTVDRPAPGLNLSYSETVSALHQIWREKYIKADFKAEQDRILAAITRIRTEQRVPERPEFAEPSLDETTARSSTNGALGTATSDLGKMDRGQARPSSNAPPVPAKPSTQPSGGG